MDCFIFFISRILFSSLRLHLLAFASPTRTAIPEWANSKRSLLLHSISSVLKPQAVERKRLDDTRSFSFSLLQSWFVFVISTMTMLSSGPYCLTNILSNTSSNMHLMSISNYLLLSLVRFYYSHCLDQHLARGVLAKVSVHPLAWLKTSSSLSTGRRQLNWPRAKPCRYSTYIGPFRQARSRSWYLASDRTGSLSGAGLHITESPSSSGFE